MTEPRNIYFNQLIGDYSVETTPGAALKIPDYRFHLTPGTSVYVTLLPGSSIDDTISLCIRLANEGFNPVPHYAARQIPSTAKLEDSLKRFTQEAGGTQVLILAGSSNKPHGDYANSMQLLESGLFDKMNISRIGIAGHPEGSPDITTADIEHALRWKQQFANRTDADMYIITQFCFGVQPIAAWEKRLIELGISLPVHVGVPGVATLGTLIKHATACGVGPSMNFLLKQSRRASQLIKNSTPEKLLQELAEYQRQNPTSLIEKLHVYPLGGLRKSTQWFHDFATQTASDNVNVA